MIELKNLTKKYGDFTAVNAVNLKIEENQLLVLLGGSGSGKTTILKMINRLIEPSSGSVFISGVDNIEIEDTKLRRMIGYCFQRVGLFPHMTIEQNISVTLNLLNWPEEEIKERVEQLIDLFQLKREFATRYPHTLSEGQQQRVGVARAMASRPGIILFDEPFASLDPITRDQLQKEILDIRKTEPFTGIFVTHDMNEAILLADQLAIIDAGNLQQIGSTASLIREPATDVVKAFFDTPKDQSRRIQALLSQEQ